MTTDRDMLVRTLTACTTLGLDTVRTGAVGALAELLADVRKHLDSTTDPECSCGSGPDYDGPQVECDLHGQPSAAYDAGARESLGNFAAVLDVNGQHELAEQCREYARSFTGPGTCSSCGCTDERACEGGCSWVTPTLCSACAPRDPWQASGVELVPAF
jgi:hypothetical protein